MLDFAFWLGFLASNMTGPRRQKASPDVQRAVLLLLSRGIGSPRSLAELAGVSRQTIEIWVRIAQTDWKGVKQRNLEKAWRIALGKEQPERITKRRQREQAAAAKAEWDKRNAEQQA